MTDTAEQQSSPDDNRPESEPMAEHIARPIRDIALLVFPTVVEQDDENEIGLTVSANGQTFSGSLISRRAWFAGLAGSIGGSNDGADMVRGIAQAIEKRASAQDPELNFLNFKNCRLIGGDGSAIASGFWRVRIDAVDAWTLGVVNPD